MTHSFFFLLRGVDLLNFLNLVNLKLCVLCVSIKFDNEAFTDVVVFNSLEQIIYKNYVNNSIELNLNLNAKAGIYFVKCRNSKTGVSGVQKLVIE